MPSEAYKEAIKAMQEAKATAQNLVKQTFEEEAQELLEELKIDSFGWTQYTPYFNDGDACVFNAYTDPESVYINGKDSYGERMDYGGEDDEEEAEKPPYPDWRLKETDPAKYEQMRRAYFGKHLPVSEFLQEFTEEDLLFMFGDHASIVVTRDGVEVGEYDHD